MGSLRTHTMTAPCKGSTGTQVPGSNLLLHPFGAWCMQPSLQSFTCLWNFVCLAWWTVGGWCLAVCLMIATAGGQAQLSHGVLRTHH